MSIEGKQEKRVLTPVEPENMQKSVAENFHIHGKIDSHFLTISAKSIMTLARRFVAREEKLKNLKIDVR